MPPAPPAPPCATAAPDGKPPGQANIVVRDLEASDYNKGAWQPEKGLGVVHCCSAQVSGVLQGLPPAHWMPSSTTLPACPWCCWRAGYLQLLSQLTKVGDYDEATFLGGWKD